jgi:hypothetical protein
MGERIALWTARPAETVEPTTRVLPPSRPVAEAGKWLIWEDWEQRRLPRERCHPQTVFVTKPQEAVQWYGQERQPMIG